MIADKLLGHSSISTTSSYFHAFLYENGAMIDLGTLDNYAYGASEANAINDNGQIVGRSYIYGGGGTRGFLYENGSMSVINGGDWSHADDINNSGNVVVYSDNHAFLYENGTMTDLGTLGGNLSWAYSINNNNQIVGYSTTAIGNNRPFLYDNGSMINLGTL